MAWVKIDDQAPRNAKLLRAGPAACWLWVCGLAHCQSQLSDGFIADAALAMMGVSGVSRCQKLAGVLVACGLFERVDGGYQVHDYHDYNATRSEAQAGRSELSHKRAEAGRLGGLRRASKLANVKQTVVANPSPIPSHPIPSETERKTAPAARVSLSPPADPFVDSTITQRAGAFVDRYVLLYQQHRKGARYAVKPVRDYAAAVTLCQTWPDDRLDKLAVIFLTTDHKFAEEGSRTVPQFLALASWCDGLLAAHESKKVAS
jgi:hypothetical protein